MKIFRVCIVVLFLFAATIVIAETNQVNQKTLIVNGFNNDQRAVFGGAEKSLNDALKRINAEEKEGLTLYVLIEGSSDFLGKERVKEDVSKERADNVAAILRNKFPGSKVEVSPKSDAYNERTVRIHYYFAEDPMRIYLRFGIIGLAFALILVVVVKIFSDRKKKKTAEELKKTLQQSSAKVEEMGKKIENIGRFPTMRKIRYGGNIYIIKVTRLIDSRIESPYRHVINNNGQEGHESKLGDYIIRQEDSIDKSLIGCLKSDKFLPQTELLINKKIIETLTEPVGKLITSQHDASSLRRRP